MNFRQMTEAAAQDKEGGKGSKSEKEDFKGYKRAPIKGSADRREGDDHSQRENWQLLRLAGCRKNSKMEDLVERLDKLLAIKPSVLLKLFIQAKNKDPKTQ